MGSDAAVKPATRQGHSRLKGEHAINGQRLCGAHGIVMHGHFNAARSVGNEQSAELRGWAMHLSGGLAGRGQDDVRGGNLVHQQA